MKLQMVRLAGALAVIAALAGCASAGRGPGPVVAFSFQAGVNQSITRDVVGAIDERVEPKEITLVVPAGTDMHALVATLSLSKEAAVTVVSTGNAVVQRNGVTPNDFSVPVTYSIAVTGEKKPWTYRVLVREAEGNARLSSIGVPQGTNLQPAFSPTVHAYTLDVPFAASKVRVDLRAQTATMKSVTVDGAETPGPSAGVVVDFTTVQEKTVTIQTLAEDGVTTEKYTVTIRRGAPDTNALLATLELPNLDLAPDFNPARLSYQVVVPYESTQFVLRARPQSQVATMQIGAAAAAGSARAPALKVAGNPTTPAGAQVDFSTVDRLALVITVTAEDQGVQQYLVDLRRAPPDRNNDLVDLTVASGDTAVPLSPQFNPTRNLYTVEVPFSTGQVTIRAPAQSRVATVALELPPAAGTKSTVTVTGNVQGKDGAVVDFSAPTARMLLSVAVTAQSGDLQRYTLDIRRAQPDRNSDLASLSATAGTFAPAFSARVASYTLTVPATADSLQINAAAASAVASIAVAEQPGVKPAANLAIPLSVAQGASTVLTFVVTAEDGSQKLYRLRINREKPLDGNALLQSLVVTGAQLAAAFDPSVTLYDAAMTAATESATVSVVTQSQLATVTIDGQVPARNPRPIPVAKGATRTVLIDVTAQNGSVVHYTVRLARDSTTKPPETDKNSLLSLLKVESYPLQPAFDPSVAVYDVKITADDAAALVQATAQSQNATLTIDGQAADRNGRSIPVDAGTTKSIFIDVRAQSGAVTRYTLRIARDKAPPGPDTNALLSSLTVENYALQPAFDPAVIVYDVKIAADDASAQVQAAAQSQNATLSIDGQAADKNGRGIPVEAGTMKSIFIDVRAQGGTVTRYTLRITRDKAATPPVVTPLPADTGSDHVSVTAKNLKLQPRELAALKTAGDQAGNQARVTVRAYRTSQVITQYTVPVDVKTAANTTTVTLTARSNGVTLSRDKLVEVEVAIATAKGKFLYYTEAQAADAEVSIEVPFLLYGDDPQVRWPVVGSNVALAGYLSTLPLTKARAVDRESFDKNSKGEFSVTVALSDAGTGVSYGNATVTTKPGQGRARTLTFPKSLQAPEGATVKYALSATPKNGKVWSTTDTTQVWTTQLAYPSGFKPVYLFVADDLAQEK